MPEPPPLAVPPPPPPDERNQIVRDAFTRYINTKWSGQVVCPVCRTNRWTTLNPIDGTLRYVPGRVVVFIPVECDNCKHTMLFNGSDIGLFHPDGSPKTADELLPPPPPEPGSGETQ